MPPKVRSRDSQPVEVMEKKRKGAVKAGPGAKRVKRVDADEPIAKKAAANRGKVAKMEEAPALGLKKWTLLDVAEGKMSDAAGKVKGVVAKDRAVSLRGCFDEKCKEPFKVSRSAIERFIKCPLCFYLQAKDGIKPPPGFPFTLNLAVDELLKHEFDEYRKQGVVHPKMAELEVNLKPFMHDDLNTWRNNFKGVSTLHEPTNMHVFGAIDDVWINEEGELVIADYKATAKKTAINLDAEWQDVYKRQMEVYQWIMRQMGFTVSDIGYIVYCNGNKDAGRFDAKLEFDITLAPYRGDDSWVEETLNEIKKVLVSSEDPEPSNCCETCNHVVARHAIM